MAKTRKAARQKPTKTRLTPAQTKLLDALLDPANRLRTVEEVCRNAGIHRDTYYEAFKRPHFVKLYKEQSQDLALKHSAQVMSAFVREATRGSFQHGKVLLEMAGLYTEKQKLEHTGKDGGPIETDQKILSRDEVLKKAQQMGLMP